MSKCVLFVEGQSEQIFVREMLLRRFNWDATQLAIRCYKLNAEVLESAVMSMQRISFNLLMPITTTKLSLPSNHVQHACWKLVLR